MDPGTPADEEILRTLLEEESPVLNTSELAREFGFTPAGMKNRLEKLEEKGYVNSRKSGTVTLWWLTAKSIEYFDG